jgi:hypothetical protein
MIRKIYTFQFGIKGKKGFSGRYNNFLFNQGVCVTSNPVEIKKLIAIAECDIRMDYDMVEVDSKTGRVVLSDIPKVPSSFVRNTQVPTGEPVVEPTVVEPTVVEQTVEQTVEPTVVEPTVVEPTVVEPSKNIIWYDKRLGISKADIETYSRTALIEFAYMEGYKEAHNGKGISNSSNVKVIEWLMNKDN